MKPRFTKTGTSTAFQTNHFLFAFPIKVYKGLMVVTLHADAISFTKKKLWFTQVK